MSKDEWITVKVNMRKRTVDRLKGRAAEQQTLVTAEIDFALLLYLEIVKHMRPGSHLEIIHRRGEGRGMKISWDD